MNGTENGMKIQVPEGDEGRLRGKMLKLIKYKDGKKLKKINRPGMIVGANRGGRLDQNDIVKDRENGSRTEHAGSDRNTFAMDHNSSEVYGKRNFKIFKHSKDEGFRRSSDKSDRGHLKETAEGAVSKEEISFTKHDEIGGQNGEKRQLLGTGDEFISNGRDLESQLNAESQDGSSESTNNDSGGHQEGNDTNDSEKEPVEVLTQQEGNSTYGTQQQEKAGADGAAWKEVNRL
ncbi:hypothetical protein FRX31_010923 [Thalictrum thalictroides]|uniref:Uncharacterized protein n=1 Tax=Thalictrum thalictroides TaxID=46969 RepID=A0A7J6WQ55_THATH|nr:hypothetical protein FRX31_010923 [Thalictrum thalictroides]